MKSGVALILIFFLLPLAHSHKLKRAKAFANRLLLISFPHCHRLFKAGRFFTLLCLLSPVSVFPQQWTWAKHIYGSCAAFDEDLSGNIYLLSTSATSPSIFAVTCMNDTGKVIWTRDMPGYASSLKIGTNWLYVTGKFKGSIAIESHTLVANGSNFNGYLAAFDLAGSLQWLKMISEAADIATGHLWVTPAENGYFHGRVGCCSANVWKFDSSGAISTHFQITGTSTETITMDPSENIYVVGECFDTLTTVANLSFTAAPEVYGFFYSAKVGKNGIGRYLSLGGDDYRYSVTMPAVDKDQNTVGASAEVYSGFTLGMADSTRTPIWRKKVAHSEYGEITSIRLDESTNVYITGEAWAGPGFECHNDFYGDFYMFFGKFDRDGNCRYVLSNAGARLSLSSSIRTGKPLVLCKSPATSIIQLGPLKVKGGYFLARIDENVLNTGVPEDALLNTSIFPNPANNSISVCVEANSAFQLKLLNAQGQLVLSKESHGKKCETLDVTELPKGNYFLSLRSADIVKTRKIVLE